jgi:Holliday junction resolvase RusA-like endonuclease
MTGPVVTFNNAYPTNRSTGKRYLTEEGLRYKRTVAFLANNAAYAQGWQMERDDWIEFDMLVFYEANRQDADGVIKLPLDSIAKAFGFNDNRVIDARSRKRFDKVNPRTIFTIRSIVATRAELEQAIDGIQDDAITHILRPSSTP